MLIQPPVSLYSEPHFRSIQDEFLLSLAISVLVHLFLRVLQFACRFKVVLGTARITQIGGGVTVAKTQRSPCGDVVGQHNVDPPQIELSPTLIERSGTNSSGFYHVVIRARFFGERFYPSLYLQSRKLHKIG